MVDTLSYNFTLCGSSNIPPPQQYYDDCASAARETADSGKDSVVRYKDQEKVTVFSHLCGEDTCSRHSSIKSDTNPDQTKPDYTHILGTHGVDMSFTEYCKGKSAPVVGDCQDEQLSADDLRPPPKDFAPEAFYLTFRSLEEEDPLQEAQSTDGQDLSDP